MLARVYIYIYIYTDDIILEKHYMLNIFNIMSVNIDLI